jgi:protein phosphatase 2C family protein 2/3
LERSKNIKGIDKSGSCALVVFIYGDTCYIANVGDSRAIMSSRGGQLVS